MSTDKGPNGYPMCERGLHELDPYNDANAGTGKSPRCAACKRWNDKVNYNLKRGRPAPDDEVTGTPYDQVASKTGKARVAAARAHSTLGTAATAAAASVPYLPSAAIPIPASAPAWAPSPKVTAGVASAMITSLADPLADVERPEPTELDRPAVVLQSGYWSRTLANMPDVKALQKARKAGLNAVLYGPPGTGKTQWVENAFVCDAVANGDADRSDGHVCSDCAYVLHGDGDTLVDDFVGGWQPTEREGQYVWIDGPLLNAMRGGNPFFVDDFTLISPKVLAVVYPVMDGRGIVQVKGHPVPRPDGSWGPDVVKAAEGFFVIAGHNPRVHGTVFSEALRSRFTLHVHVPSDYELAELMGVDELVIKVAKNMETMRGEGTVNWVPQMRDLLNYMRVKENLGPDAALANLAGLCPEEDQHLLLERIKQVYGGQKVEPLALGGRWAR